MLFEMDDNINDKWCEYCGEKADSIYTLGVLIHRIVCSKCDANKK